MYSAEQALEQIWNDSGDGDLFNGIESEFEMSSVSEDESHEFSDDVSLSREENSAEDSKESSDDKAQGSGDGGNQAN